MLKPDAVKLNLQEEILKEIRSVDLHLVKSKTMLLTKEIILTWRNWPHYDDWFWDHVDFMTSSYVEFWIVEGEDAITKTSLIKVKMRGKYAVSKIQNIIHSPDNETEAKQEIDLFFEKLKD